MKNLNKMNELNDENSPELTDIKEYLFSHVFEEMDTKQDWLEG